jgi:hypothetical protein
MTERTITTPCDLITKLFGVNKFYGDVAAIFPDSCQSLDNYHTIFKAGKKHAYRPEITNSVDRADHGSIFYRHQA